MQSHCREGQPCDRNAYTESKSEEEQRGGPLLWLEGPREHSRNCEKCVSCKNSTLSVASSSRQAAATSMCTTPGATACSTPSGADSSLFGGPPNKTGREKHRFRDVPLASLASAPLARASGPCGGYDRCQTPADVCEHCRLNRAIQTLISDAARTRS